MTTTPLQTPAEAEHPTSAPIAQYAEDAYLSYAMSVVTGRALPSGADGQKPVQRRILFDMHKLGLHDKSKPVKCARFVGDILGKYHPHGDSSVYEAAVRMAQPFALRYPLIDGHGNFGTRDGDGAAAMRYTEARLTPYAELLLGELDMGATTFEANYDGTLTEPVVLPARLPVLLLNGASGIAVGMATEIPSHNLREVAAACMLLVKQPNATLSDVLAVLPGPDFPCGAQIISAPADLAKVYETGRGPIRTRARWAVEHLARGQWRIAITELPPGTSTSSIMLEIDNLANPQIKAGKKALTPEQLTQKTLIQSVVERIKDDSDGQSPVRLLVEPRSSRLNPDDVMQVLLAHTSLECNFSMNLVAIGQDGRPQQKSLMAVLNEWLAFRRDTILMRTNHRLGLVNARLHIIEGRQVVFGHLDDIIHLIRNSEEPKTALMTTFGLTDTQATDILELRFRQLAKLESMKLAEEHTALTTEAASLRELLQSPAILDKKLLSELKADSTTYGDDRRTLIEPAEKVTLTEAPVVSEPVTILISRQGWWRARTGHKVDLESVTWRAGDECLTILETRSDQAILVFDTVGRAYNVQAASVPTGRGDGVPVSTLIELSGARVAQVSELQTQQDYVLLTSGGYGFICPGSDLVTRQKAGKVVVTMEAADTLFPPIPVAPLMQGEVIVATSAGKLLVFGLGELKRMPKAKGVQLVTLNGKDIVSAATAIEGTIQSLTLHGAGKDIHLAEATLAPHRARRARAGAHLPGKMVATGISVVTTPGSQGLRLTAEPTTTAPAPPDVPPILEARRPPALLIDGEAFSLPSTTISTASIDDLI